MFNGGKMLQTATVSKTPISIRLDDKLLEMLDKVQETRGTIFWDRDRTWLIEHAIEKTYGPVVAQIEDKEASNGSPS